MSLSSSERRVLLQATGWLILLRLALPWLSVSSGQKATPRKNWRSPSATSPDQIAWAIHAAARFIPGTTCLVQALAAQILLNRYGHDARLAIGVAKETPEKLEAHAWITCEGRILIGAAEAERYTPLQS